MTKDEAAALLKSQGAGTDGSFFIRDRGEGYPDEYVMCVIYRGNPTHHLIVKKDGLFFINRKPTDESKTLSEMVEYLRAPGRPNWPVPLKDHVPNGNANTEEPLPPRPSSSSKPISRQTSSSSNP